MTDAILSADEQSVVFKTLNTKELEDYSYSIPPAAPILGTSFENLRPDYNVSANPVGEEVIFTIRNAQMVRNMALRSDLTLASETAGDESGNPVGLKIAAEIQIKAQNRLIMKQSAEYIQARVQASKPSACAHFYAMSYPVDPTTGVIIDTSATTSYSCTTPIFCSWFEDVSAAYDASFYETISVHIFINTKAAIGNTIDYSASSFRLWVWSWTPNTEYHNFLKSKNSSPEKPLNMLMYNTTTERTTLTSLTENEFRINNKHPTFNSYFMVKKKDSTALIASNQTARIDSFDVSLGGTQLLRSVPRHIGDHDVSVNGLNSGIFAPTPTTLAKFPWKISRVPWCLEPDEKIQNTGGISFANVNVPMITVYTTASAEGVDTTASLYEFVQVHEYWNFVTFSNRSGSVAVSVSV